MQTTRMFFRRSVEACPFYFIVLSMLFTAGCGTSVTRAQFDRIKLAMSVTEVEEILGKGKPIDTSEVEKLVKSSLEPAGQRQVAGMNPELDYSEVRGVQWGNEKKNITVIYKNDRVFRVFSQGL